MRAYYYLFYKFYKFWEKVSTPRFWSEWKASLSIIVIQIWLIISLFVYYKVLIDGHYQLNKSLLFTIGFVLFIINYLAFHQKDKWEIIVEEFDNLSKKKNTTGSIIVWSLVILIIVIIIFSFYLMSKIDGNVSDV
ncbi:MAG: hypothetical protein WCY89_04565 [Flavobacteriaceae bacterium]